MSKAAPTVLLVVAVCAVLIGCGSSSRPLTAPSKGARTRDSIVAAALAQRSVHLTRVENKDLVGRTTYIVDVTKDSGSEVIEHAGHTLRVRSANGTVYVQGDAYMLNGWLPLTQATARRYAGQWISIPGGNKLYTQDLPDRLTLASIVYSALPRWKLRSFTRTSLGGKRRLVLLGESSSSAWLYSTRASATAPSLPTTFSADTTGGHKSGRFSRWNESVKVHEPATSTPIATISRG